MKKMNESQCRSRSTMLSECLLLSISFDFQVSMPLTQHHALGVVQDSMAGLKRAVSMPLTQHHALGGIY